MSCNVHVRSSNCMYCMPCYIHNCILLHAVTCLITCCCDVLQVLYMLHYMLLWSITCSISCCCDRLHNKFHDNYTIHYMLQQYITWPITCITCFLKLLRDPLHVTLHHKLPHKLHDIIWHPRLPVIRQAAITASGRSRKYAIPVTH